MDRPIANENQGQLTDEEFGILKAADEKMKRGVPKKNGWFWFYDKEMKAWAPASVLITGHGFRNWFIPFFGNGLPMGLESTTDDQWAGEIPMPEDSE